MIKLVMAWFSLVAMVGCASSMNGANATPGVDDLVNLSFELESVDGQNLQDYLGSQFNKKQIPSIEFQQGLLIAGQAGCNRFFGKGELNGSALSMKAPGSTMMMCEPKRMTLETAVLNALKQGVTVELVGEMLTLTGERIQLSYRRTYKND